MVELTDANFESEVLQADRPVVTQNTRQIDAADRERARLALEQARSQPAKRTSPAAT